MIVVRSVFRLKFGKTREAVALFREGMALMKQQGPGRAPSRLLTDLVSSFYTIVFEQTFESLTDYENSARKIMADEDWKAWYQKLLPLVETGHREIYTIVE